MALQKPSPGLLPAENYSRFGLAFNTIDLLAAQLPFAQQAIAALLDANTSHGGAITGLQADKVAHDQLIGALQGLTDAQGKAITAEQSRAATAEALARIIAAPKYSVPLDTITLPNGGAVYWNGSTSTGAGETSGGLRVPQGQTGIFSQHRTRFQPTAAQRTKLAGRPVQFMVAFRSTVGALTALRDSAGFSTLGGVIEGVPSIVGVKIYSIRPDLWLAVGDAVLTGNESVITIALQVSGNTLPVAADVSFVAIGAMFMPVDATGTSDVLADFVQPLALRADNLIAAARVRYAPLLGAGPGVTDRVLVIPAGQSGAGSLAIYGAPVAGLQAGTRVRCRFAIQVAGGAFVSSGVAQSDPPVTLIELFGATVEMTDGSQVGAVAGLTATSPTTYEASVTFTATGAERIAEFYLKVDENSAVRLTEGQIRLGQMFVDVLSTEPTTTAAAQTARLTESFRAFIAAAPDRFRDWASASSLSDGDYGTIREAVAAMRTGGSQDQPNRVVVLPGTYTNECATGVSINPADYVEIVGKGARRDVEIIARLPDNQAAQDSQQPLYIQRSCRVSGLTVRGRNVKYPGHLEAGNAPVAAIWDIDDCEFVHEGATGWTETSALGVGQNDGSKLTATGSTFLSPTSGVGIHNNVGWARGARADFTGCSLIGTGDSATSLAVTSQGAGVMSTVNLRGCVLSGRVHHYVSFLPGTPLSAYRGAPWEYTIRITDSDPVDWLSPCPFDVLTLTSVPAANSAAAVGNTGAVQLFGRRPDVRAGAADYAARLHSSHLVSVPEGQFDPGVGLGARLGDMRGAAARPLDIFWDGSGTPVTISLDQNYAGMTNAQVLASLNGKLSAAMGGNTGGRAFSLSQPYHNRAPIRQPDREATAVNSGTATILKGHALAKAGRRVRLMTATDATSLFAGIALDDAVPGRSVRFLKTGAIGQAHLLFDGDQAFTAGARFQISATNPGRLVAGADLPVLAVRSAESYGAALEIIETAAYTGGSTAQAVRDAFATITYQDVPGLPAVVDTLAGKGANSDITSLSGLVTPLSQAQGGTGAKTAAGALIALGAAAASDIPVTVASVATALDAGPWVAVQRALDKSLNVVIDGMYELGDAILLPRSGHRIRAKDKTCGFKKSASTRPSYLSPMMILGDVMNVEIDGVLFDMRNNLRHNGVVISPTALGTTGGIRIVDCQFRGCGSFMERYTRGVIYERCFFDGLGDFANPSQGSLGGIGTGGSHDPVTGAGTNVDGLVSDIWIVDCAMRNYRSELIDINWNTSNVYIVNLIGDNWGTDGTVNEAIDVGGGSGAAVCSNIHILNPTLTTTAQNGSNGVRFKLGSRHCALIGGELKAPAQAGATSYGVFIATCYDVRVEGVTIRGWTTSINAGGGAGVEIVRNYCDGPYAGGIAGNGTAQMNVNSNTINGLAGGTSQNRGIILQSCLNYTCLFNTVTGSWGSNAILLDSACSGLCFANDNFTTASSISNQGARSAAGTNAINEIGGLPITGGTLSNNLQVNGNSVTQYRASDDVNAPQFVCRKSRGTTSAPTVLQKNDQTGSLSSFGHTGAGYLNTMQILSLVIAETPSPTDMQSRLRFLLNPAGSVTLTEILALDHTAGLNLFGSTVIDANRCIRLRTYTVATLPTPGVAGRAAYATNGRAFTGAGVQEGVGAGTGVEVNDNGTAWKVAGTNATVVA